MRDDLTARDFLGEGAVTLVASDAIAFFAAADIGFKTGIIRLRIVPHDSTVNAARGME